jgi:hypothetical protein
MTRIDKKSPVPTQAPHLPARKRPEDIQAMLREIAFVLHCTRKVKSEILADLASPVKKVENFDYELALAE